MAEPEQAPNLAEAVGPPAGAAAPDPAPANPAPAGDAAAVNPAEAMGPPAAGTAAPAEGAPPAEGAAAPPPGPIELTPEELEQIGQERIRKEEEAKKLEEERIRLGEERIRLVEEQRSFEVEEGKRIVAARLRMLVELRSTFRLRSCNILCSSPFSPQNQLVFQKEEIRGMKQENTELQRRVVALQKKRRSVNAEQFILEGQDAYFHARPRDWSETKYEFNRMKDAYDKKIDSLRDRLQEKADESNARHEGMIHYFWKIARDSLDIVSFQRIPRRVLQELEQEDRDTVVEFQAVRTRGRQLKSQQAKLELKLALKDQLQLETGNLRLVDYEQLRMENESLNEKERGNDLANDDKTLHGGRIKLSYIETSIITINRKMEALQKIVVNIKSPTIWDDMDYKREDIEVEEKTFQDLKKRYHDLTVKIEEYKNYLHALKAIPLPVKKVFTRARPPSPPIKRGSLRWGIRREGLGQMVVQDMVEMMAEQSEARTKYETDPWAE